MRSSYNLHVAKINAELKGLPKGSKKWWHLIELMRGRDLHPNELSSLRSNLPKGGDCRIDVFDRSVKVSRESPYVLVSGTKQLDVKNAALMIRDALQTDGKGTKVR